MCSSVSVAQAVEQVVAGVGGADEELLVLVELRDRAEAALVERVGRFDSSEGWRDDGDYSFACWLRSRADVGRIEAGALARLARDLQTMPATRAAVAGGKLSVAKARLMAGVVNERTRAQFDEHERFLLDQVRALDVDQTKIVLRHWQRLADRDGPDPSDPARNRASLDVGWDGRTHLEADLDPVGGAVVKATLDAIIDRLHQDGRFNDLGQANTAARRRADALVEMALRASGRTPDQPTVHPKIIVIVPWERLLEKQADPLAPPPELIGTGPVGMADVARLGLLGTVATLTLDAEGRPLDLGPEVRLASGDQWIALKVRDRGCVAPGCDRPAEWCSAHHLRFFSSGGPTDLANLCLLCSHHHHLIHDQHWTLEEEGAGVWKLRRPDGTTVLPPRYTGKRHRPTAALAC